MADGDVVISLPAVTAAPLEYDVKQAEWFAIKQVQALYTDNSAAGAWLPALEIVAPGGIVTGRYVGTSVAAGDGQEVTFYPLGSKGAGGGAAVATADYVHAPRNGFTLFDDVGNFSYPADYLAIGNSAMFQDDGSGRPEIIAPGLYEVTMSLQLSSATIPAATLVEIINHYSNPSFPNDATNDDPGNFPFAPGTAQGGTTSAWVVWQIGWLDIVTPPCTVWFAIETTGNTHTAFDSADAAVRIVRLTEASSQGL